MKGRIAVLDQIDGRSAAALIVDGRLQDLLIDPIEDGAPQPGAVYRAIADRPLKGQNGLILRLGSGQTGFLRQAKGISPGTPLLVQVNTRAEAGKAAPVTTRLLFKSRYAIVTPDAPGLNVARSIHDEDERERLQAIANDMMDGVEHGLILRTACEGVPDEVIESDIADMLAACEGVLAGQAGDEPELLLDAPSANVLAWRDWVDPDPDQVLDAAGSFEDFDVWSMIEALRLPDVQLGTHASMAVEPTRALVAVDVNTGGDFSFSAGLKANLAAAADLPRQLRLRGLGGQVVVDFAPMNKKDRRVVEHALRASLKKDGIETSLVGWTPLGHFELQRKRERIPLEQLLTP